jgi:hypothetical protein
MTFKKFVDLTEEVIVEERKVGPFAPHPNCKESQQRGSDHILEDTAAN